MFLLILSKNDIILMFEILLEKKLILYVKKIIKKFIYKLLIC